MHLSQIAKRPLAALAALSLLLGACSSTEPDAPFDPAGTSADFASTAGAFDSPVVLSYGAVAGEVSAAVGGSPSTAVGLAPSSALATRLGAVRFAQQLATRLQAQNHARTGQGPSFSTSSIPSEIAGKTFEFDVGTQHYVATDRPGAPADGVRFILYEIDPETGMPAASLTEVGYVQLTASESGTSQSVELSVVGTPSNVTYFHYKLTVNYTASSAAFTLSGSVTNGVDNVNFNLSARYTSDQKITINYVFAVPTSGFRIETLLSWDLGSTEIKVSILARGPHGRVSLIGTSSDAGDSYTVRVNGELFATITVSGSTATILGPDGQPLSEEELTALQQLMSTLYDGGLGAFFQNLISPFGPI